MFHICLQLKQNCSNDLGCSARRDFERGSIQGQGVCMIYFIYSGVYSAGVLIKSKYNK